MLSGPTADYPLIRNFYFYFLFLKRKRSVKNSISIRMPILINILGISQYTEQIKNRKCKTVRCKLLIF